MGGVQEDVVKILDKKYNSLPDYCYFTDESDLFYEYNKENCERKKRKLENRVKKFHEKSAKLAVETVDEIYMPPQDSSLDDYMTQTTEELLKSLNDEIQDIKNSRISYSITDNDDDIPFNPNDEIIVAASTTEKMIKESKKKKRNFQENNVKDLSDKKKKRKIQRQQGRKESTDDEWNDRRSAGRQEARRKNDDENWFLKRQNDREIHRLKIEP